jgi:hypothetical protein
MNARDDLMELVWLAGGFESSEIEIGEATDAILAAGYVKPRTITTIDELDELPVGSVLIDRDRDICQRFRGGWRATIHEPNDDPWLTGTLEVDLPATVIYSPEASA